MSDYEHWVGKLVKVEKSAEEILAESYPDVEYDEDYSAEEALRDEADDFIVIGGNIYSVVREGKDAYDDILNAQVEPNGVISFEVKYYNGGCGFSEAIESALKRNNIEV